MQQKPFDILMLLRSLLRYVLAGSFDSLAVKPRFAKSSAEPIILLLLVTKPYYEEVGLAAGQQGGGYSVRVEECKCADRQKLE
jgi:hypothetical protein